MYRNDLIEEAEKDSLSSLPIELDLKEQIIMMD